MAGWFQTDMLASPGRAGEEEETLSSSTCWADTFALADMAACLVGLLAAAFALHPHT